MSPERLTVVAATANRHKLDEMRAIFGDRVEADGEEVLANLELWEALYEVDGSSEAAWSGLLSALLRDPDFLFY